jgi:hypothetical protein
MPRPAVSTRRPTRADLDRLVENMRPADRAEVEAMSGPDVHNTVRRCLYLSSHSAAVEVDGQFACLMGVAPVALIAGVGSPWMLGTKLCDRHGRALVAMGRLYIAEMHETYRTLEGYVHAQHVQSVRWLARLGFSIAPPCPMGVSGQAFHYFEKTLCAP